ncbi:MAG: DUF3575 domain-containing protein [Bacteroidales bacterium]|nr:DUF3575 domain-containing protein [Bacteroidales bacterium]
MHINKTLVKLMLPLVLMLSSAVKSNAQNMAVKTNLLYDATATANLGVEIGLAPRWTFDLSGNAHLWNVWGDARLRHWMAQPELRYWFCERFNGHFLGLHALGGVYNFGNIRNNISYFPFNTDFTILNDNRYEGWGVGGGIAYGYDFIMGRHWNLELELGLGVIYTEFDRFECKDCGAKVAEDVPHTYYGPTKAALNLVYTF